MLTARIVFAGCLGLAMTASAAHAQDAEASFHKAYYLEVEENDPGSAIELYKQIVSAEGAPADVVQRAKERLSSCIEKVRSADLARLMPSDVLLYAELRNPGEHLVRLLELAGLAHPNGDEGTSPSSDSDAPAPFAVSPRLLEALKGVQGAAVAVTDIDPRHGTPAGVAVIHPGDDDLVHGLIETGLASARSVGQLHQGVAVDGHPCYVSEFGSIVVTDRLVVAGNPHELVVEAIGRLKKADAPALCHTGAFAELAVERDASLFFTYLNAQRLVQVAKTEMARGGELPEEYRMAQAIGDVESLEWAALTMGTNDQGIGGDLWVRLDSDNHALPYHLVRTPALGRDALRAVPSGVAGFLAFGLSEERGGSTNKSARSTAARYVTGLDIGREFFANVNDVLAFVQAAAPAHGGPGMPEVGIVFTVKDSARSEALWGALLSVPATLMHADANPVRTEQVAGREVQVYAFPNSVSVHVARLPDRVVLATGKTALTGALQAADGKDCILSDPAFAAATKALSPNTSKLAVVHAGRALEIAGPFLPPGGPDAQQLAALLKDVTVSMYTDETPSRFHAGMVMGVPDVRNMLEAMLAENVRPSRPPYQTVAAWSQARVEKLIPRGSDWKYSDTGEDLGTAWRQPDFDDSAWKSGSAPFGYGESDLATVVDFGSDPTNKQITTYFRKSVVVEDPERFSTLKVLLRRDDGAAVYINGREVARDNLPADAAHDEFSTSVASGESEVFYYLFSVKPETLRRGKNTVAVEIHQCDGTSSDILFDLSLEGAVKSGGPKRGNL